MPLATSVAARFEAGQAVRSSGWRVRPPRARPTRRHGRWRRRWQQSWLGAANATPCRLEKAGLAAGRCRSTNAKQAHRWFAIQAPSVAPAHQRLATGPGLGATSFWHRPTPTLGHLGAGLCPKPATTPNACLAGLAATALPTGFPAPCCCVDRRWVAGSRCAKTALAKAPRPPPRRCCAAVVGPRLGHCPTHSSHRR